METMMKPDKLATLAKDQKTQEQHLARVQWRVQRKNAREDTKIFRDALESVALASFADMQNAVIENDVVTALKCMKKLNIHPLDVDAGFLQEVQPLPNEVLSKLLRSHIVIYTDETRKRGWQPGSLPYEDDVPYGGDVDIDSETDTSTKGESRSSDKRHRMRVQVYKKGVKYWNRSRAASQSRLDMIAACNFTCPLCKRLELNQHAWVAHLIKQGHNSSGPSKVCVCMRCYGDWLKKHMPKKNKNPPFRPKGGDIPADGVCPGCKKKMNTSRRFWRTTQDPVVCWRCGNGKRI